MKYTTCITRAAFKRGLLAVALLGATTQITQAQAKLNPPSGWSILPHATDDFQDSNLGWQWTNVAHNFFLFEESTNPSGPKTWSHFRQDNVNMTGGQMVLRNRYHSSPQSGYSPYHNSNITYTYSGGWCETNAEWLTEGQFQANSKVDWKFANIWPAFWTVFGQGNSGGDELDIMEYQINVVNHSHHVWNNGQAVSSKRVWDPWQNPTPKWESDWAIARVTSWSNWACKTTRNTQSTFYINGKKEHTSSLRKVVSPMSMIFSSSPHRRWRPNAGNYPSYRVQWVETHIP